jgi:flagellar P-ring protein precursor FlgI
MITTFKIRRCFWLLMIALFALSEGAHAARVKEMASISGQRGNQLVGYGLVVGLDATGDSSWTSANSGVSQSVASLLESLDVTLPPGSRLNTRNVAAVMLTAELPALAKPGQKLDVTVSSLGDARSLKGGTLLLTPMRAANGVIYATAQGSIVVPSAEIAGRGQRLQANQMASGRLPAGAYVELAAPEAVNEPTVELNFEKADYAQTLRALDVIAGLVGRESIAARDARTLIVRVPTDPTERMGVLARILEAEIPSVAGPAKVVFNARTGSVVMNQSVSLAPFAVTHGNITVRVTPRGRTYRSVDGGLVTPSASVTLSDGPEGKMMASEGGTSLEQVVQALNRLGVNPQDMMAILQAIKASGALGAELEVI